MDRLNVPAWYKQTSHPAGTTFLSSSYSTSSPPSWKSSIMTSSSTSSSSTSSSGHWKTIRRKSDLQNKENIPKIESHEVKATAYCGWRKSVQTNCDFLVSSPSQRLAKTLIWNKRPSLSYHSSVSFFEQNIWKLWTKLWVTKWSMKSSSSLHLDILQSAQDVTFKRVPFQAMTCKSRGLESLTLNPGLRSFLRHLNEKYPGQCNAANSDTIAAKIFCRVYK